MSPHARSCSPVRGIACGTLVALAAAGGLLLSGCKAGQSPVNYARAYPETLPRGEALDIQIIRGETTLELTNTTSRVFGPSTLWLNAYFSRPIEGLAVGQSLKLPLADFRNEHGEPFRGGGFFATKRPERMVLGQLESDGTMYPLVVTRGEPVIK